MIRTHPDWWAGLEESGRLGRNDPPDPAVLALGTSEHGLDAGLRIFRNREMMRIVWRELTRAASVEETLTDLSRLAEICLEAAVEHHHSELTSRHGTPRDTEGVAQRMVVLGLGKLGGGELNLSSDIDLVFAYPAAGECDGRRGLANEQFFTRLARAVIRSLGEVTEHGFCFRVDTRLRPFGQSGPLISSFGAMEQYYQREGRDWERYALIKARVVAGDQEQGASLLQMLQPFVYRRYIDFGAVEALQGMHTAVLKDAAERGRSQDIKRGPGGIREVEFLVQAFQLLRGGREPRLRTPSLLQALRSLPGLGVLEAETATRLHDHYFFLRRLENAIQALHDQQTHVLPDGADLDRVARAMGLADPLALSAELERVRNEVHETFLGYFEAPEDSPGAGRWIKRWAELTSMAEQEREALNPALQQFLSRLSRQSMSQRSAQRLDRFMPLLLKRLDQAPLPAKVLSDVLELVLAITRRSPYLSLLVQNPQALERMIDLFTRSDWVATTVIRYPALLDELIDPTLGRLLPGKSDMDAVVQRILGTYDEPEDVLQALNHFKLAATLRIAVAELLTTLTGQQVRNALTELAEALLEACLELAEKDVSKRFGAPAAGLVVIGYGSLGARELSYGSDLDLIFLHQASDPSSSFAPSERIFTQVARRLLSLMVVTTASGKLYETDTRLRPNGRAGLLVSTLEAFDRYQREHAWTWELQALTRARPLCGDSKLRTRFESIRAAVLSHPRETEPIRHDIARMRQRMRREFRDGDPFKHVPGGLVDIDFIAQLGVLEAGPFHPGVLQATSTDTQLEALAATGWLDPGHARVLADTHERLSRLRQLSAIARNGDRLAPDCSDSEAVCRIIIGARAETWFSLGSETQGEDTGPPGSSLSG